MTTYCAWCPRYGRQPAVLATTTQHADEVSHGICAPCLADSFGQCLCGNRVEATHAQRGSDGATVAVWSCSECETVIERTPRRES